ncbi:MAG: hypothetical protein JNM20_01160 [Rhizobiales bacterium]|nr:hypothetical protein [Hyphomicrobiales bacterium]
MSDANTASNHPPNNADLTNLLRLARIAEAAHFEAALDIRDAKTLRLQVLKDDLAPVIAANAEAGRIFDLSLVPGEPPKLWIDLITAVVMEPDQRTYRLIRDTHSGREIVAETASRPEIVEQIKLHMAHQLVARERRLASAMPAKAAIAGHSSAALILAWLSGFTIGVLALFMIGLMFGRAQW